MGAELVDADDLDTDSRGGGRLFAQATQDVFITEGDAPERRAARQREQEIAGRRRVVLARAVREDVDGIPAAGVADAVHRVAVEEEVRDRAGDVGERLVQAARLARIDEARGPLGDRVGQLVRGDVHRDREAARVHVVAVAVDHLRSVPERVDVVVAVVDRADQLAARAVERAERSIDRYHVIYQMTHDSIFLGEDGPTHQPIEHLASLRAMPRLHLIRPADSNEVKGAWIAALNYPCPSMIVLSRQNLPLLQETNIPYKDGVGRGAYIIKKEKGKPDFTFFSTGSEVSLALDVAKSLETKGKNVRVVSVPSWRIFENQDQEYKKSIVEGDLGKRVAIEAASPFGWERFIGQDGIAICMEDFGASAPQGDLADEFGFTVDAILDRLLSGVT